MCFPNVDPNLDKNVNKLIDIDSLWIFGMGMISKMIIFASLFVLIFAQIYFSAPLRENLYE